MWTAAGKASPVAESKHSHFFNSASSVNGMGKSLRKSRSDGWKLASYEVAGGNGKNKFVLKARWMATNVPSSFQDGNLFGAFPDASCLANFRLSLPGRFFAEAGAQSFFQPARRAEVKRRRSEGAGKGGGALPVREIGEVIVADGCRQSFAGVRVLAHPFFQRRVIRQRDGKKFAPLCSVPGQVKSSNLEGDWYE